MKEYRPNVPKSEEKEEKVIVLPDGPITKDVEGEGWKHSSALVFDEQLGRLTETVLD